MIIVSACLIGHKCKYNGGDNRNEPLIKFLEDKKYITVCPEVDGGLPIKRSPAEISTGNGEDVLKGKGQVITIDGEDVTDQFVLGAQHALKQCIMSRAKYAILKEKSPSCGSVFVYDGSFSKNIVAGAGVTTSLLRNNGIVVLNENNFNELYVENDEDKIK